MIFKRALIDSPNGVAMSVLFDTIILGAGPAGLSAGFQAARLGRNVLLIERGQIGGHLINLQAITDYLGFPEPISGAELGMKMYEQASQAGMKSSFGEVTAIHIADLECRVEALGEVHRGRSLIICTGTSPQKLEVPGEEALMGSGVSYCVICDAPLYKGMDVAVVGTGDMAAEDALYLSKIAKRVVLIGEGNELQATRQLKEEIQARDTIEYRFENKIESLASGEKGIKLRLKHRRTGEVTEIIRDGIFVSLGRIPNTQFLRGKLPLAESKYLITNDELLVKAPNIFAAGQVRAGSIPSVAIEVGEGARAAHMAERYLASQ